MNKISNIKVGDFSYAPYIYKVELNCEIETETGNIYEYSGYVNTLSDCGFSGTANTDEFRIFANLSDDLSDDEIIEIIDSGEYDWRDFFDFLLEYYKDDFVSDEIYYLSNMSEKDLSNCEYCRLIKDKIAA